MSRSASRLLALLVSMLVLGPAGAAQARQCESAWQDLVPFRTSLSYTMSHGMPFSFDCEWNLLTVPADPAYSVTGQVTVPAATARALGLRSKVVAEGRFAGPKPNPRYNRRTDSIREIYVIRFKDRVKRVFKARGVAYLRLHFVARVTYPAVEIKHDDGSSTTSPGGTDKVTDGEVDFKLVDGARITPKCTHPGSELTYGCP